MSACNSKARVALLNRVVSILACVSVVQARCLSSLNDSSACTDVSAAAGTGLLQTKATQAMKVSMPAMSFFEEEGVQSPTAGNGEAELGPAPHDVGFGFGAA